MQLITHSTTQDTGEGGPLDYKSIGNQSQLQVAAQKHTYMLAAGQVKRLDKPIPMVTQQSILPYAWTIHTIYQGGTEPPGGEKTEEEERGAYVIRCG